jgi:Condensation domain
MRRKLSHTEHIVEGNIVYFVRLEGSFSVDQFRSALSRVQHKHPALRTLIRKQPDGLYYEADSAPEIPLRIVPRVTQNDYQRERETELRAVFAYDQPQLRAVWLRSERESDLLLTTSHRVCDGMSMLTIVREVLRSLHSDEELIPYQPITLRDIVGDYQPPQPWKRKLSAELMNAMLRLIPSSRRAPENNEHFLEWRAGRTLLNALKQRCKAEGVSVHAALLVALDRALLAVFGKEKMPKWIENPVDIRRGRFAALKSDMVFFCGGNFKVRTGQAPEVAFWTRARAISEEIRKEVERELLDIPSRFHFSEMLRPVTSAQVQSIVRLGDALKMNGSWNRFAFSNLGNVVISDSDAPFRVKDLRLYMHSVNVRVLCLVTYTLNDEMCFYCVSDEKCMSRSQVDRLQREFMALLQTQILQADDGAGEASRMPAAIAQ